jgi:hypothetical protein
MAEKDDGVRFGYYLTDFIDAGPFPFTLNGWAKFLSGSTDWHDRGPLAEDGAVFTGHRMTFRYLPATYGPDGWDIPEPPPGHVYHAIAYGIGDGWDVDSMGETLTEILGLLLTCDTDGEQWIVCRQTTEDDLTLRFCASCPCLAPVTVQ